MVVLPQPVARTPYGQFEAFAAIAQFFLHAGLLGDVLERSDHLHGAIRLCKGMCAAEHSHHSAIGRPSETESHFHRLGIQRLRRPEQLHHPVQRLRVGLREARSPVTFQRQTLAAAWVKAQHVQSQG